MSLDSFQDMNGTNGVADGCKGDKKLSEITENMPAWKQHLLKKKNEEILAEMEKEKAVEEAERQKYGGLPGWKAEILRRKDEERVKKEEEEKEKQRQKEKEEEVFNSKPGWQQELIKRRSSYSKNAQE